MSMNMSIEEFLNACEQRLRRAETVVQQPLKLEVELIELEEFLRCEWPDAIIKIKDSGITSQYKETIDMIFKRITNIETIAKTNKSLFDGLEDFMQRSSNR